MDSINFYDIKTEKANALLKYRQLRKITNLFRFIVVLVVLLLLSRLSVQLPHVVKNSGSYFKGISGFVVSPRCVFVIGNAIVLILFAKSGRFSADDSSPSSSGADLYEEFLQNSEKNQKLRREARDGIEYQAKIKTPENASVSERTHNRDINNTCLQIKSYTRSQSENFERELLRKNPRRSLKRSETEKSKKNVQSGESFEKSLYPEDNMSNEEFRSKVEAFIARQQKFRLQEEKLVN